MASILTNTSAMVALQNLRTINNNLVDTQNQIATGKKIATATDNSAIWAVSKVIESDVSAFKAISDSLNLGDSTVAVAREALGRRRYGNPPRDLPSPPERLTLCYGVRSADYLAGLDDFTIDGLDVQISTDDGTRGYHGFVSELLEQALAGEAPPDSVYCCGPQPLMRAVQAIAAKNNVPCWLSLETPMACGCGICFSCVVKVQLEDGSWDYRRACVEGPVFPAHEIVLSE